MARRKGKSRSRIKDWDRIVGADEQFDHTKASRESFTRRAVKLPPRQLSPGAEDLNGLPRTEGMVTGLFPGGASVLVDKKVLLCGIAGTYRAPQGSSALAVGDIVTVALTRQEHLDGQTLDKDRSDGMILERRQRRTVLSRPQPRSQKRHDEYETEIFEKVIVVNMDVMLIVASTHQPPLSHGLIDRFLIIAERGDLTPILVINKIDLGSPDHKVLEDFRSLGIGVEMCSALRGDGLDDLCGQLTDKRSVLVGASGVGKSAMINAMVPGANAVTRKIRTKNQRGRHTTSSTVIYNLPPGGIIVDTPGVRELGIRMGTNELSWYFPEFEALAGQCKFRDCSHTHEPNCAVIEAVQRDEIHHRRYQSYLNILQTLEDNKG